ncbi:MAG: plasmid pRiA4b ORF-3 family protein, partial [Bacillota bacterium]
MSAPVYELRIELKGIYPTIWRRFRVPSDIDLEKFHQVMQRVMGWEDAHLFAFRRGKTTYAGAGLEGDWNPRARDATVADVLTEPGDEIEYMYDFGDSWEHRITLLDLLEPSVPAPACLEGARACPPEDCGGVPGYYELLEILSDPIHEYHEEMLDWTGGGY